MLLIINHKANLTHSQIKKYEKKLRRYNVIVLPTLCYLPLFQKGNYILGSQDISQFKEYNRTGEINGEQLKQLKVKYCLIGHSDRIEYNKENNNIIKEKLNRCFENDITPLYCIGETKYETYKEEIMKEIDLYYENYKDNNMIIIYEPQKNIGNDEADFSKIEEILIFIKKYTSEKYDKNPRIIYGGGVRTNILDYIKSIKEIDGIIISKKSLNIKDLKEIYEKTKK